MRDDATTGETHSHPLFAQVWARLASLEGSPARRAELLGGVHGAVLEIGAGQGRNFACYPREVRRLVALEPEPHLRALAHQAAELAPQPVSVVAGIAERLPFEENSFDAVICSLVLCSVTDQRLALEEIRRVLKPGGQLRFYEHVIARGAGPARLEHWLDGSGIWPRLAGGCHLARDTENAIRSAGLRIERIRRFSSGLGRLGPAHILGVAHRD